jgi:uncharacterized delta-60 repeat protein
MKPTLIFLFAISMMSAAAQDGTLDITFADNAVQSLINPEELAAEFLADVEVMDDDRIVIAGNASYADNNELLVSRLMPNGSLDTDFGDGGYALIDLTIGANEWLTGMALQGDKIILAGNTVTGNNSDFFVTRLNVDGTIDETFGMLGAMYFDLNGENEDVCNVLRLDSQDRILLGGWSSDEFNEENAAVLRLTPEGMLDTSFSDDGMLIWSISSGTDEVSDIVFTSDNNIMLLGSAVSSGQPNMMVGALDDDGEKIFSYGTNGRVLHPFNDDAWSCDVGLMHDDGSILLIGHLPNFKGVSIDVATFMIDDAGDLVDTWGIGGLQSFDFSLGGTEIINDAILYDDHYILAGAKFDGDFTYNSFVVRLDSDGVADEEFGEFGTTVVDVSQLESDIAYGIAIQGNGLIVAGTANSAQSSYGFVYRLLHDFGNGTSIESLEAPQISIYPNPTTNQITIAGSAYYGKSLAVYDHSGRVVLSDSSLTSPVVNVSHLPVGVYVIHLGQSLPLQLVKN